MARYVPIAKIEAEEIRIRTLIERRSVAARAIRVFAFLFRCPAKASAPFLDSADRDACDLGNFAVDQTLPRQA